MRLRFEYDEAKRRTNKVQHGIDFVEAQALWLDPDLLSVVSRSGRWKRMNARELDKRFDEGVEDVIDEFDLSMATRPNREQKRVTATRAVDADDVNLAVCRERRAQVGATKTRLAPRSRSRR